MFDDSGILRVDEAFSPAVADSICELIWTIFARYGMSRDDPETWGPFRKRALDSVGASPVFDEILTDRLAGAVDTVLDAARWDWPSAWGDFLITFPNAPVWSLPHTGWHQDWTFSIDGPPRLVKAFVFLNDLGPGGGGTLVVTGSHRLRGQCGWLRELCTEGDPVERRRRFMDAEADVEGVALRVVELTGRPGDVVLIHPWLVHAVAPNAGPTPRFMRAPVFVGAPRDFH
jgi:Phytanoyl-CoA dioxygenase (PhyH)